MYIDTFPNVFVGDTCLPRLSPEERSAEVLQPPRVRPDTELRVDEEVAFFSWDLFGNSHHETSPKNRDGLYKSN